MDCEDTIEYLDLLKQDRIVLVDKNTQRLISEGFTFNNEMFSLSQSAQLNWLGIKVLSIGIAWPLEITTKNDTDYLLEESDLDSFIYSAQIVIQGHIQTGRYIKQQLLDAADETELNAIEDNR